MLLPALDANADPAVASESESEGEEAEVEVDADPPQDDPLAEFKSPSSLMAALEASMAHGFNATFLKLLHEDIAEALRENSALADLSEKLLDALQRRCGPAVAGLERDPDSGLCFFAVENSKGFKGDPTIRHLVQAIERTARKQPSMKLTLPAAWLRVLDALKKRKERCILLEEVRSVAQRHGLPSADVPLEEELAVMLTFFHSRNAAWSKCSHLVVEPPHSRPPRSSSDPASEGLGLLSALGRRGPAPQIPQRSLGSGRQR